MSEKYFFFFSNPNCGSQCSVCNVEQEEQWIFILWRACRKTYESGIVIIIKANIGREMEMGEKFKADDFIIIGLGLRNFKVIQFLSLDDFIWWLLVPERKGSRILRIDRLLAGLIWSKIFITYFGVGFILSYPWLLNSILTVTKK